MRVTENYRSPINLSEISEISDRTELKILEIAGGWGVRRHFNQIGIQPGDCVRVVRRAPFGGPVLIENRGTRVAVGRKMAEKIQVEVLERRT
jgi:Fe2+ transport system protein FeoA